METTNNVESFHQVKHLGEQAKSSKEGMTYIQKLSSAFSR